METRYPGFDVLHESDRWDAHTQKVVKSRLAIGERAENLQDRLGPHDTDKRQAQRDVHQRRFLTEDEWTMLRTISGHLLYENRDDVLTFVVSHIDQRLSDRKGEADRKPTLPPEHVLIRTGIELLDMIAHNRYGNLFQHCDTDQQFDLLAALQKGSLETVAVDNPSPDVKPWSDLKRKAEVQKGLFKKMLGLMVDALASHPVIWSEMGYAGPAYPRGYYRIEKGLTDPWEPRSRNGGLS